MTVSFFTRIDALAGSGSAGAGLLAAAFFLSCFVGALAGGVLLAAGSGSGVVGLVSFFGFFGFCASGSGLGDVSGVFALFSFSYFCAGDFVFFSCFGPGKGIRLLSAGGAPPTASILGSKASATCFISFFFP